MRSRRLGRRKGDDQQLSLPVVWLSEEDFIEALWARGARSIRSVRFKRNRTRMISLSQDHLSLNVHTCFRSATGDVLDAIATFVRMPQRSVKYRDAVQRMRSWWDGQVLHTGSDSLRPRCCGTAAQRAMLARTYARLNQARFGGRLPDPIAIRLSDRMSRRLGHVHYANSATGRSVDEIALNVDLMIPGNERHLVDTLVHEMAHIEAWLDHGHREHGEPWRSVARRVGCETLACTHVRIRRRRNGAPVRTVPRVRL
jgi:hypothetical protein